MRCWRNSSTWIEVTGNDRESWLQGQITQNLVGTGQTFLTSPTGQFLAHAFFRVTSNSIILVTDQPDEWLDREENFVVTEDVTLSILDGESWTVSSRIVERYLVETNRSAVPEFDVLLPAGTICPGDRGDGHERAHQLFLAGWPDWERDVTAKSLPPELGSWFENQAISYTKGCYTGQEVLQRIHTRGHTNRTRCALIGAPQSAIQDGDDVLAPSHEPVGTVSRVMAFPSAVVCSGMIRNESAAPGATVLVRGVEFRVAQFPLDSSDLGFAIESK